MLKTHDSDRGPISLPPDFESAPESLVQWFPEGFFFGVLTKYARSSFQHWSKIRLIHIFARLLRQKVLAFEHVGRFQVDVSDYICWSLLTRGSFEPRSLSHAVRIMRNAEGVFLDVGAHHGLYVVAVGVATGCNIVAVEGSAGNFRRLSKNVTLNSGLRTRLVNCCATANDTLVQLSSEALGRSAWTRVDEGKDKPDTPFIAGMTLEHILTRLNAGPVRLFKIDVEGYEMEVFRGVNWSGVFRPQYVLMECNPSESAKMRFLLDRGYTAKTVDGTPMENVESYPEGNLLFVDNGIVDEI